MVNAVSNSVVPKITVIVGGSFVPATTPCAAKPMIRVSYLPGPQLAMR